MRLISRELASPADRGVDPCDLFQGVTARPLALPAPATVDNEERVFLIEVAVSALLELQDKRRQEEEEEIVDLARIAVDTMREMFAELPPPDRLLPWGRGSSPSAACAVAMPALVSLSESETEEDALVVIA